MCDQNNDDFIKGSGLRKDPVIEFYKARIDHEKIRESLALTMDQRMQRLHAQSNEWKAREKALEDISR